MSSRESQDLPARIHNAVWGGQLEALPAWRRSILRLVRLIVVLARDLALGQLTLRAMSLVYTTLLSIVPLLALSFSVLKAFGVHNQVEPLLMQFLAPLGEEGVEVSQRIIEFVDNLNVGVLGSAGLAMLLYTAVSMIQKLEESFNFIWHVSQPRSLSQRFSRYLSVLLVGPILVFAALGLTAGVSSTELVNRLLAIEPFGRLAFEAGRLVPYLLVIGAFTFVYVFVPNTRVRLGAALIGGIIGGVLWQTAGWAFAAFIATSTQYAAIYSSFAILILFLIWLYMSWLILLVGADVTFYWQHPQYLVAEAGEPGLSNRMRERLALLVISLIGRHHLEGRPAWTLEHLSQTLHVPAYAVDFVVGALRKGELLIETNDAPPGYLPARDIGTISVMQVLNVIRTAGEDRYLSPASLPVPESVAEVIERLQETKVQTLEALSVRDLVVPAVDTGTGPLTVFADRHEPMLSRMEKSEG